jgi:GNAT superfamily N-acetyltransferase
MTGLLPRIATLFVNHSKRNLGNYSARYAAYSKPVSPSFTPRYRVSFFSSSVNPTIKIGLMSSDVNLPLINALCLKTFKDTYPNEFTEEQLANMYEPSRAENSLSTELRTKDINYLYVKDGDRYVGYAKLHYQGATTLLEKIYLLKEYQGKQLGKKLLHECCKQALIHNQQTMELFVWEKNVQAIKFYERWGFVCSGTMEKEFGGHKVKGFIMGVTNIKVLRDRLAEEKLEPRTGIYLE